MKTALRILVIVALTIGVACIFCCTPTDPPAGSPTTPGTDSSGGTSPGGTTPGGTTPGSSTGGTGLSGGFPLYDPGTPTVTDLWIDPVNGNDDAAGTSRGAALQTLRGAWGRLPAVCTTTGYRINVVAGNVPFDDVTTNYYDGRTGTQAFPIIIRAADGRGTATFLGGLNFRDVHYLYLYDVRFQAGGASRTWGNNILHFEASDHVLMNGITVAGPIPDTGTEINESIKVNQCSYVYLENSEVAGGHLTGVDWVSVQHGHILGNRIHDFESDWGTYLKGGTAYIVIAGNEYYNCLLGFSAGQATNFEIDVSPYLHYECYDIKFVNNLLHDIRGNALGVQGGYNVLMAYNTAYRVATDTSNGYALLLVGRGTRGCYDTTENGAHNAATICNDFIAAGGWCPPVTSPDGDITLTENVIPNRNVYVYNNIFYNPTGASTRDATLSVFAPMTPPAGSNIPSPAFADENLRIVGNIIWDGPADHPLGVETDGSTGCADTNATCNNAQLRSQNRINSLEPQLIAPAGGNYRPTVGGNVFTATTTAIPDFSWSDAPTSPPVSAGALSNAVGSTLEGSARTPDRAGAY